MCTYHYNINDETRIENSTRTITMVMIILCVFTPRVYNNYIISWNVIRIDRAIAMRYNLHVSTRSRCNRIYRWLTNRVHPLFFLYYRIYSNIMIFRTVEWTTRGPWHFQISTQIFYTLFAECPVAIHTFLFLFSNGNQFFFTANR